MMADGTRTVDLHGNAGAQAEQPGHAGPPMASPRSNELFLAIQAAHPSQAGRLDVAVAVSTQQPQQPQQQQQQQRQQQQQQRLGQPHQSVTDVQRRYMNARREDAVLERITQRIGNVSNLVDHRRAPSAPPPATAATTAVATAPAAVGPDRAALPEALPLPSASPAVTSGPTMVDLLRTPPSSPMAVSPPHNSHNAWHSSQWDGAGGDSGGDREGSDSRGDVGGGCVGTDNAGLSGRHDNGAPDGAGIAGAKGRPWLGGGILHIGGIDAAGGGVNGGTIRGLQRTLSADSTSPLLLQPSSPRTGITTPRNTPNRAAPAAAYGGALARGEWHQAEADGSPTSDRRPLLKWRSSMTGSEDGGSNAGRASGAGDRPGGARRPAGADGAGYSSIPHRAGTDTPSLVGSVTARGTTALQVPAAGDAAESSLRSAQADTLQADGVPTTEELTAMWWPRSLAARCVASPDFESTVVVLILANTIVLCLYDPLQPDTSAHNQLLSYLEIALNVIFTLEMLMRIWAVGGVVPYLSKPWNVFDASMVLVGYTVFLPAGGNGNNTDAIRALRALRALRVLRLIARFESLRGVVVCFFEAVPMLLSVVYLLLFVIFIYAVAGTQLFMNVYHNTCEDPSGLQCGSPYCLLDKGDDPDMFGCGGWGSCPSGYECVVDDKSTAINTANFDNVLLAMLVMFQCITLSGWDFIMYRTMDGSSPAASIFYVTYVCLTQYFVIQLFLAVLKAKFAKAQQIFHSRLQIRSVSARKNRFSKLLSSVSTHFTSITSQRSSRSIVDHHNISRLTMLSFAAGGGGGYSDSRRDSDGCRGDNIDDSERDSNIDSARDGDGDVRPQDRMLKQDDADGFVHNSGKVKRGSLDSETDESRQSDAKQHSVRHSTSRESSLAEGGGCQPMPPVTPMMAAGGLSHCQDAAVTSLGHPSSPSAVGGDGRLLSPTLSADVGGGGGVPPMRSALKRSVTVASETMLLPAEALGNHYVAMTVMTAQDYNEFIRDEPFFPRSWHWLQYRARAATLHPAFNIFFITIVTVNLVVLSMDYYDAPLAYSMALEQASYALTGLFTVEVVLKLVGLGFWDFISDGWNWFDTLIIVTSLIEIFLTLFTSGEGGVFTILRVLRAMRVLRIIKLFHYIKPLQRVFNVIFNSLTSFMAVLTLLGLFLIVFGIIGLHIFGGLTLEPYYFPNFDTFVNSLASVFNVLAPENMQNQMYSVVRATSYGAVLYYISWVVIGKYVLLSLFLAVTLEASEVKYNRQDLKEALSGAVDPDGLTSLNGSHHSRPSFSSADSLERSRTLSAEPSRASAGVSMFGSGKVSRTMTPREDSSHDARAHLVTDSVLSHHGVPAVDARPSRPDSSDGGSRGGGGASAAPRRVRAWGAGPLGEALETFSAEASNGGSAGLDEAVAAMYADRAARRSITPAPPPAVAAAAATSAIKPSSSFAISASAQVLAAFAASSSRPSTASYGSTAAAASSSRPGTPVAAITAQSAAGPFSQAAPALDLLTSAATSAPILSGRRGVSTMLHAQSSGNSLSGFASAGAPTAELARGLSELPRPSSPLVSPLAHSLSTALGDRQQQQQQQQQLLRRHDPFGSPHHVPTDALDEQMLRHAGGGTVGEPPATTTAWGSRAGHSFSIRSNGGAGSPGHSITEEASTRSLGQPSWVSKVQQKPSVVSPKPRHLMPPDSERTSTGSELPLSPLPVDPWRQRPGSPGTPSSAAASPVHSPPLQVASPPTHLSSGNCIASVSTSAQHRSHPSSPSAAASSTRAVSQSDSQTAATATAATATAATAAAIRNGTQSSGSSPPRVIDTSVCAVPSGGGTGVLRGLSRCPTVSPSMVLFESPNDTRVDPAWRQNARRSLDLSTPQQQQQQQQLQRNGSSAWHRSRSRLGGKPAATSPLLPQFFMSNATFDPDATRSAGTAAEGSPRRRRPDPDASYGPEYDEETEELERILMGGVSAPPAAHAASGTGGSAAVRRPETADRAAVLSRRPPSVAATTADGDDSSLFGLQKLSTQQSADLHRTMVDLHHSRHAGTTGGVASPRIASVSRSASRLPLGTAGQSAAASSRRMSLGGLSVGSTSTTGHVLARQMQAPRRSSELMNGDDGGHLPRSRTDEPTSLFGDLSNHRPDGSGQQRCSTPGSSTTTTRFLMPQDRRAISPQPSDVWQAASKDRLILTPNGDDSHHKPQQRRSAQSDPFDSSRQEDALQRGDDDDEPGPAPTPSHHHHHNAIPLEGKSFWYFGRRHRLRRRAYNLVHRRWFDNVMFTLILANCVTMAMEHPRIVDGSPMDRFIFWSNVGFTFCFTVEAALKIFACTFILYIRRLANQVDFAIVVVSLVEILLEVVASGVGWAQALRVLRVFKPLRTLTRSRNMQLVFRSLTMSLAAMAHVTLVLLIFFLMFAILGTQLFMGRFYRCNDASVHDKAECVDVFIDYEGMAQNRTWNNQFPNFDNVGNALLVCFITATLNGYTNTMEATMSAPLRCDVQPQLSMNALAFFWYLGFGVVVSFTLLNLYVGVIFSQFSKMRLQSQTGSAFLTPEQQEWAELSKMVFRLEVPHKFVAPTHWLRLRLYHLVRHPGLDTVMMAVVCLNVVTMAMIWWQQSEEFLDALDYANVAFTAVYVAEAVLKIAGLGWRQYWRNAWNKFDFVLAVVGVSDVILTYCVAGTNAFLNVQKLLRLARLARMIKLMRSASGIKHMVKTLIAALPAFGNIFALLALFYFMYAYVGVWLLGLVDHGANLNRWANFDNFLFASMTLFRIATGDNWSDVLMGSIPYNGVPGSTIDNGGTYAAIPYILSFYIVIPIIMVNLFTAVIIETFDKENEQDAWKLSPQALDEFVALWAEYDDGSGTIATASLEALLLRLDPPLGLGPCATNKDVLHFVYDLDIPLVHGRVPFHKTAFELVKRCSMANIPEGMLKQQMDALVVHFFRDLQEDKNNTFTMTVVVQKLQRKWRTRLRAARLQRKMRWRDDRATAPSYVHTWSRRAALLERAQSDSRLISSGVKSRWSFPAVHSPPITAASEARGRFPAAYTSPATSAGESHRLAGHPAAPDEGKGHWQYIQRLFLGKKLIPKNG